MIHSIISIEDIFYNDVGQDAEYRRVSGGYAEYVTINGRKRMRRLVSTDPSEYLKADNQPYSS